MTWLGWVRFTMFHRPAWAVGSYRSGPPAGGTPLSQPNQVAHLTPQTVVEIELQNSNVCVKYCNSNRYFVCQTRKHTTKYRKNIHTTCSCGWNRKSTTVKFMKFFKFPCKTSCKHETSCSFTYCIRRVTWAPSWRLSRGPVPSQNRRSLLQLFTNFLFEECFP